MERASAVLFPPSPPRISTLDRLLNGLDSDADLFMYRTKCISYHIVLCKKFDRNEYFSPGLAHKKFGVQPGPNHNIVPNRFFSFLGLREDWGLAEAHEAQKHINSDWV